MASAAPSTSQAPLRTSAIACVSFVAVVKSHPLFVRLSSSADVCVKKDQVSVTKNYGVDASEVETKNETTQKRWEMR